MKRAYCLAVGISKGRIAFAVYGRSSDDSDSAAFGLSFLQATSFHKE